MNRLKDETSPYLRQHADNPVDWYPWCAEAFAAARTSDKPILLSVGYSACHWCHVMAHESFEDPGTAQVMNELFINIKVDREERPDVDTIYMEATQAISGRGGWPMTVFLTPEAKPFHAGTYYPKTSHPQMPSFTDVMHRIKEVWTNNRADVEAQANQLTSTLNRAALIQANTQPNQADAASSAASQPSRSNQPATPTDTTPTDTTPTDTTAISTAAAALRLQYDAAWGGFGGAPKFPQSMNHEVLLRCYLHTGDPDTLNMVINSLDAMASGGIFDHLGGGFSRYSVDAQWIVPHFEKMLYDNALLARLYLHAWQVSGRPRYRQVLDETVDFVLRDLRHPNGGFYSALDADSEGEEGKFYVWTPAQITSVLGADATEFMAWYGVTQNGNFEGKNILWRPVRGDLLRSSTINQNRERLLAARNLRIAPGLDDKVLLEWNGLMLSALAEAAAATGNQQWLEAAIKNGCFLLEQMRRADGRWLRSWQAGNQNRPAQARHLAYAADYAAIIDAFTRLAEASGQSRWINEATKAADGLLELFWDHTHGGVFSTGLDAEELICRPKEVADNAVPSANSASALALLRLGALTGKEHYATKAQEILALLGTAAAQYPNGFGHLLEALDVQTSGITEVVVTGNRPDLTETVWRSYRPNTVLAWGEPYDSPLWQGRSHSTSHLTSTDNNPTTQDSKGAAYVCHNYACLEPAHTKEELRAKLPQVHQNEAWLL
ncbi:MAG: thioredoxin domain-containing protein [bacterium]|nr:thioredoxin domain-containing protein [bacterium]